MSWTGVWRNQYGSTLVIGEVETGRFVGSFETALEDSGFFGRKCEVAGIYLGHCISFAFASRTSAGDAICAFTGILVDEALQMAWHVVSASKPWPHAVQTNVDTFRRVSSGSSTVRT